ncbi:MAG: transposase [Armatimonadota bacterium]|nr:transposase [Armatimonadota bacterium]MDR7427439.1 transposase [Armatimonadota bacterium]MDR7463919.1 transposase [Armatimonadota bacterium]MDR7468942.1 transposase [Armatimonadota bacterium]MDR7475018.1 transposase [Armatimonadota bacterium]
MRTLVDRVVDGCGETPVRVAAPFVLLDSFPAPPPASQGVVLAALGLSAAGTRRFLAVEVAEEEKEEAWRAFLARLAAVMADRPLLVCASGQPTMCRALRKTYPRTYIQVSVTHRLLAWARQTEGARPAWLAEVRRIFTAPDLETAVARFRAWRLRWRHRDHRVVEGLEAELAAHLAFYRFPRRLWKKVRTAIAVRKTYLQALRAGTLGRPTLDGAGDAAGERGALVFYRTVSAPAPEGAPVPDPVWSGATPADVPEPGRSPVGATV